MKRARSASISNRLRSASELCEDGRIDKEFKGALKDMIIRDDPKLQHAMKRIEEGDPNVIQELKESGVLQQKGSSDLMGDYGDLNFDFLNVGGDGIGSAGGLGERDFMETEGFDFSFNDDDVADMVGSADKKSKDDPRTSHTSKPIDVGGRRSKSKNKDIRPLPVKGRTGSFKHTIPELFEFNLFDEQVASAVSGSPLSSSPNQSMGSVGGGSVRPRLHRDSISIVDDFLLNSNEEQGDGSFSKSHGLGSFNMDEPNSGRSSMGFNDREFGSLGSAREVKEKKNKAKNTTKTSRASTTKSGASNASRTKTSKIKSEPSVQMETNTAEKVIVKEEVQPKPPTYTYNAADNISSNPTGFVGGYSPDARRRRIEKFMQKRQNRVWQKRVKYDVRKNFADSRLRVKGRFVKKEDEELLRELMLMTC